MCGSLDERFLEMIIDKMTRQGASLIFCVSDQASMRMLDFLQEVCRLLCCIDNPSFQPSLIANRLFPVCVAIQTDTDHRLTCRLLQGKCERL